MHDSPSFRNDDASNGGIIFAVLNFRCLPHEMEILTDPNLCLYSHGCVLCGFSKSLV